MPGRVPAPSPEQIVSRVSVRAPAPGRHLP
jgi:hypothetical protein